jgi:hypothetical protein
VAATIGDVIAVSGLAFWGIMMAGVPAVFLVGTLGAVLAVAFLLDEVKIWFFRKTGILGGSSQTPQRDITTGKALVSMAVVTKRKQRSTFEIRRFNET